MKPILSEEDRDFFETQGYVVVPNAVPIQLCENVIKSMFAFLGMERDSPDDWYRELQSNAVTL